MIYKDNKILRVKLATQKKKGGKKKGVIYMKNLQGDENSKEIL